MVGASHIILGIGFVRGGDKTRKSPNIVGLFTLSTFWCQNKKGFISFVHVRVRWERGLHGEVLWVWFLGVKERGESSSLWVSTKPRFLGFVPMALGKEKKKKEEHLLFINFFSSSSPPDVLLQSLKRFKRFEERIQISQQDGLRTS